MHASFARRREEWNQIDLTPHAGAEALAFDLGGAAVRDLFAPGLKELPVAAVVTRDGVHGPDGARRVRALGDVRAVVPDLLAPDATPPEALLARDVEAQRRLHEARFGERL